tara:strand:- start:130 stop:840 length:711 start_codon:yes stop_codon:yes gene_type:complete
MIEIAAAASIAAQSFKILKTGFSVGRDLESMAGDLSRWMGALSDLSQAEKEIQNPPLFAKLFRGKSIEQESIEIFAAKRQAESQRNELRQFVQLTLGQKAWNDLLATEARIRKQRAETIYKQREKRRKFVEIVAWVVVVSIGLSVLTGFVLLLKAHTARANDWANDMTVCRLVKCMKMDKNTEACVYRGAHNTQETLFFSLNPREWKPREYLCQWNPDQPPPPSAYEVLKAIRESQ